jgi:protein-disulfide isomerase
MKKFFVLIGAVSVTLAPAIAQESGSHPWLDKQLAKQRVKCPPGKSPFRGPAEAPVTIVEFIDYECPYCADEEKTIKKVLETYPTQVKLVIKNLPLDIHPRAKHKALFAECMGMQDKFWQAHDGLLKGELPKALRKGLDEAALDAEIAKGGDGQVDRDLALAKNIGMATTPGFVIDGIRQSGVITFPQFKLLVDAELARKSSTN